MKIVPNEIYNIDCIDGLNQLEDNYAELVLTDIPYGEINRKSHGLRNLDKSFADELTFDISNFVKLCIKKCSGSIYIWCGTGQVGLIRQTMTTCGLSTRLIIWEKTNPSPMNGEYIWLSGIECCVFGRKKNATFNAKCRNSVLRYPCGRNKLHPTEKNINLFKDIIIVSSNAGDLVLDPCIGSGTTAVACIELGRRYIGFDINKDCVEIAKNRILSI